MTIRLLDEHTINQIAAGEVIENAASVVKELLENALDAHAASIRIEVRAGGKEQIVLIDDGSGIAGESLRLAVERYTTSKIRSVSDLENLSSMGFRGEALSSIAAISQMRIVTKEERAEEGSLLVVEAGRILCQERVAAQKGTRIEVSNLFFNAPARRKFQKSVAHDLASITKVVTEAALAHPDITFQLADEHKILLQLPKGSLQERVKDLMVLDMVPCTYEQEGVSICGFLSPPSHTRPNRSGQHLFINKRPVLCPSLASAVLDGYATLLEPRRYPLFVLHLTLPSDLVDVNVHPQKKEVRLLHESVTYSKVVHSVSHALQRPSSPIHEMSIREPAGSFLAASFDPKPSIVEECVWQEPEPIVGIFDSYILVKEEGGLLFIDSKALLRLLFYREPQKTLAVEDLLIPLSFTFSPGEALVIERFLPRLQELGFSLYRQGETSFALDAKPASFSAEGVQELLDALLEKEEITLSFAHSLATHYGTITPHEAAWLVSRWKKLGSPPHCPKGKVVAWLLSGKKIGTV